VSATLADFFVWLDEASRSPRGPLAVLRDHAGAIRALHDDDHERALREIRRRFGQGRHAGGVPTLLDLLGDRTPNPRPQDAPPPEEDAPDGRVRELEAEIAGDPDAPAPYAVYADLLQERGDPLGALIAIGQELRRQPGSEALRAAHRDHLAAHRKRLLGPLADCEDMVLDVEWCMGFIRACRITARGPDRPRVDLGLVVRWLLERPGPARFLHKLVVDFGMDDDAYDRACAALARRPRPTLRVLRLGGDPVPWFFQRAPANAADVWPRTPGLRELSVCRSAVAMAPMRLPALERLWLNLPVEDLPGFAADAELPSLERLALGLEIGPISPRSPSPALAAAALDVALRAWHLPRLRALEINAASYGDELCPLLARAPLVAQLEELDLGWSGMTDAGAAVLHDHRAALRHLHLRVRNQRLSPAGRALLEASVGELTLGELAHGPRR
jgi:uncharacterized protein (TIGR02996 family)